MLLVANDEPLGPEWLDHPLQGDWADHRGGGLGDMGEARLHIGSHMSSAMAQKCSVRSLMASRPRSTEWIRSYEYTQ